MSDRYSEISVPISTTHRSGAKPRGILRKGRKQGAALLRSLKTPVAFHLPRRERPSAEGRTDPDEPDVVAVRRKSGSGGGFWNAFRFGAPARRRERTDDYDDDENLPTGDVNMPEPFVMPHAGRRSYASIPETRSVNRPMSREEMDIPPMRMPFAEPDMDSFGSDPGPSTRRGDRPRRVVQLAPDVPSAPSSQYINTDNRPQMRRQSRRAITAPPPAPLDIPRPPPNQYQPAQAQPTPAQPTQAQPAQLSPTYQPIPVFVEAQLDPSAAQTQPRRRSRRAHSAAPRPRTSVLFQQFVQGRFAQVDQRGSQGGYREPPTLEEEPIPQVDGRSKSLSEVVSRGLRDISNFPWVNRVTAEYHPGTRRQPSSFRIPEAVPEGEGMSSWYNQGSAPAYDRTYSQSNYAPKRTGRPTQTVQTSYGPIPESVRAQRRPTSIINAPPVPPKSPSLQSRLRVSGSSSRSRTVSPIQQTMVVFQADGTPMLYGPPGTVLPQSPILITNPQGQAMWYQPMAIPPDRSQNGGGRSHES